VRSKKQQQHNINELHVVLGKLETGIQVGMDTMDTRQFWGRPYSGLVLRSRFPRKSGSRTHVLVSRRQKTGFNKIVHYKPSILIGFSTLKSTMVVFDDSKMAKSLVARSCLGIRLSSEKKKKRAAGKSPQVIEVS